MTQPNQFNWMYIYVMVTGWSGVSWFVYEASQTKSNITVGAVVLFVWWIWLIYRAMKTQHRRNARRNEIFNNDQNIDDYCSTCYELLENHTGMFHVTCKDGLAESIIFIFGIGLWIGLLGKLFQ